MVNVLSKSTSIGLDFALDEQNKNIIIMTLFIKQYN